MYNNAINVLQPSFAIGAIVTTHIKRKAFTFVFAVVILVTGATGQETSQPIRVGIIGLDTSHSIAFTKLMNTPDTEGPLDKCQVVCALSLIHI